MTGRVVIERYHANGRDYVLAWLDCTGARPARRIRADLFGTRDVFTSIGLLCGRVA